MVQLGGETRASTGEPTRESASTPGATARGREEGKGRRGHDREGWHTEKALERSERALVGEIDVDGLNVGVVVKGVLAELAADTRRLVAAERHLGVELVVQNSRRRPAKSALVVIPEVNMDKGLPHCTGSRSRRHKVGSEFGVEQKANRRESHDGSDKKEPGEADSAANYSPIRYRIET